LKLPSLKIEIDPASGFCFGVVKAVEAAELSLKENELLNCLGDIVHNQKEVDRLDKMGMTSISTDDLKLNTGKTVLIRAHGEPPLTYKIAKENNHKVIDATCPVVLKLQQRVKKSYETLSALNGQVLIYGKKNHAEVIGLLGQTDNNAIVLESIEDINSVDLSKPTHLYAQTTKSVNGFQDIATYLEKKINEGIEFKSFDTICRQVSNRLKKIDAFAKKHELIIFVGGAKSSNAQMLFKQCLQSNTKSYFVNDASGIKHKWFAPLPNSVGICGATSTPPWLMEEVAEEIKKITDN